MSIVSGPFLFRLRTLESVIIYTSSFWFASDAICNAILCKLLENNHHLEPNRNRFWIKFRCSSIHSIIEADSENVNCTWHFGGLYFMILLNFFFFMVSISCACMFLLCTDTRNPKKKPIIDGHFTWISKRTCTFTCCIEIRGHSDISTCLYACS